MTFRKSVAVAWPLLGHCLGVGAKYLAKDPVIRKQKIIRHMHSGARKILRALGVESQLLGQIPTSGPYLICANHISYLDPLLITAHFPSQGITSTDTRLDGLVGSLIGWLECPLVSRKIGSQLIQEMYSAKNYLMQGSSLQFYPEATSTDGTKLLPFRPSFFQLALETQVPVLPLTINFKSIEGQPIDASNRDLVYYYGNTKFFPHLKNLLRIEHIFIEIICHPLLNPRDYTHRREMSKQAEFLVRQGLAE